MLKTILFKYNLRFSFVIMLVSMIGGRDVRSMEDEVGEESQARPGRKTEEEWLHDSAKLFSSNFIASKKG